MALRGCSKFHVRDVRRTTYTPYDLALSMHCLDPPPILSAFRLLCADVPCPIPVFPPPSSCNINAPIPALRPSRSSFLLPHPKPYHAFHEHRHASPLSKLSRVMLPQALLISALAAVVRADCYSHDGIKALDSKYYKGPELVSCGNGTDNCCLDGQKCGSNLLCVDGSGGVSRQYCDNAAWIGCSDMCAGKSLRQSSH